MREIKFRFWNRKEMLYNEFHVTAYGEVISFGTALSGQLMQFTGLLDKNGKEIYEGDVVYKEVLSKDDPALDGKYGDSGVVQWGKDGFIVKGEVSRWYDYMGCKFDWVDCEVIGNIYENPELHQEINYEDNL